MNNGKTSFVQLMAFLPWMTFAPIVARFDCDRRVRTLTCAEQYRAMAFAQLTWRESLRDIETCPSVHASKSYHMGFRQPVRRSTLADANEGREWRIHAEAAQRLIVRTRKLYDDEEMSLDLVLPEAGAINVMDRARAEFSRLHVLHQARAIFITRAKSNMDAHRAYSAQTERASGINCDQTTAFDGNITRRNYPEHLRRIRFKSPETGKTPVFIPNNFRQDRTNEIAEWPVNVA